jgi:hypothetical protein
MIEKQYIAISNDIGSDEIVRNEAVVEWLQRVNKETIRQMVAVMLSRVRSAKPVVVEPPTTMGEAIPYDLPAMNLSAGGQFNVSAYSPAHDTPKLVYAAPPRNYDTPVITTMDVERERKEKHAERHEECRRQTARAVADEGDEGDERRRQHLRHRDGVQEELVAHPPAADDSLDLPWRERERAGHVMTVCLG